MFGVGIVENGLKFFFLGKGFLSYFLYVPLGMVFVLLPYAISLLHRVLIWGCTVGMGFCTFGYGFCTFAFFVLLPLLSVPLHRVIVPLLNVSVILPNESCIIGGDF